MKKILIIEDEEKMVEGLRFNLEARNYVVTAALDGETGFLVAEKDEIAFAQRLDYLLDDRALGEKMGQQGREFICETFELRNQTLKLEAIYNSIIG